MAVLPMFPLGSVLLPGQVLPLHVFEPRYRALVHDCLAADRHEFGVVLIERGSEVGGGDQRSSVGVVAQMVQVAELHEGRFAVVAVGVSRIRVVEWLADAPYPRAEVEPWPDERFEGDIGSRLDGVHARVRRAAALAVELGDVGGDAHVDLSADPVEALWQLAALAPIGAADAFRLLCAPSAPARLALLDGLLDDVEAAQQFRLGGNST
jgi:Lon protease-like protein